MARLGASHLLLAARFLLLLWNVVDLLFRLGHVGVAASIKLLRLPYLPDKGDISDWIAAGGTQEQLVEC
jgi:hypothetical protein